MTAPAVARGAGQPSRAGGAVALLKPDETQAFAKWLFQHVDWTEGGMMSVLGIGEKGTHQEGKFRERKIFSPLDGSAGQLLTCATRWAEYDIGTFIVPAVIHPAAQLSGDVTADKIKAFTALVLDLDSGDIGAKIEHVTRHVGEPSMAVKSGGRTAEGQAKVHLWWKLTEPTEEVDRVGRLRKLLAAKVDGDQSFGRVSQVVRLPGSVHLKNSVPNAVSISAKSDIEYDFDELAGLIEAASAMDGVVTGMVLPFTPMVVGADGGMDFSGGAGKSVSSVVDAFQTDVRENGLDGVTRWGQFNRIAGALIYEASEGQITLDEAFSHAWGWADLRMKPEWDEELVRDNFNGLLRAHERNHGPIDAAAAATVVKPGANADRPLPIEYFDDIQPNLTNSWLVRGLIPQSSLAMVYGHPGSGKSFLAGDIGLRLAAGMEVNGKAVKHCPVIYVAAEGQAGFRGRVAAFRQHHEISRSIQFALVPTGLDLLSPTADLPRLIEGIAEAARVFEGPPGLIIIDTLAATFGGGDENTSAMITYVNHLAKLRDEFGATVMVVHHRPKDPTNNTPRGHGSLAGAMDAIINVDHGKGGLRIALTTKQKDAEPAFPMQFDLIKVVLGRDEEGEEVSSAVVAYRSISTAKVSKQQQGVIDQLQAGLDGLGTVSEATAAAGWFGCSIQDEDWRAACDAAQIGGDKEGSRRKAFDRAKSALIEMGRVGNAAGRSWLIEGAGADAVDDDGVPHSGSMDFSMGAGQ